MAKKRFHQSKRDRRDERRGEYREMAHRDYERADYDYAMAHQRQRERHMDHDYMIREDHNAIANLPQQSRIAQYPKTDYLGGNLNDTITGADRQMRDDHEKMMRHRSPEKY